MVVSVKLRIKPLIDKARGSLVEVEAGVNSHYPALLGPDQPEILLPISIAEKLGLYPPQPNWDTVERISVGGPTIGWFVRRAISVCVVEEDRIGPEIIAHAYIIPGFPKVLISDAAIKPLGIWMIDEARGLWCFSDELRDVIDGKREPRKSYKA